MCICFTSCTKVPEFWREKQLKLYLKEEHDYEMPIDRDQYFIVFSGQCGSCNDRSVNLVTDLKRKYPDDSVKIILHKDFTRQLKVFDSLTVDTFYDKDNKLMRYGLDFEKNLFLHYNSGKLKYWNWLYLDKIFDVRKHLELGSEET